MKIRSFSLETLLYLLAFGLALLVRLLNLGVAPLSEYEAAWAMQALHIARPEAIPAAYGPHPAYISLTGLAFSLFGANNFLARFWPALAGALLILAPALYRRQLGRNAAILLAFGLALDPGLVAASRLAGGPALALTFSLLAIGLWLAQQPVWAGLTGGLALLSGPAIIPGLLGFGLTALVFRLSRTPVFPNASPNVHAPASPQEKRGFIITLVITVLLVSSLFMLYPQGLAAWVNSLTVYLSGWSRLEGIPASRLFAALAAYQPFALLVAIAGLLAWAFKSSSIGAEDRSDPEPELEIEIPAAPEQHFNPLPIVWTLIALFLALLYPSRQALDLVWVLVAIWTMAASSLDSILPTIRPRTISLVHGSLMLLFAYLFWFTLLYARWAGAQTENSFLMPLLNETLAVPWPMMQIGMFLVLFSLAALTTVLIAIGWDWPTSRDGLLWGLLAISLIYTFNTMWGATQLRPNRSVELWNPAPTVLQADLLIQTLETISKWQSGFPNTIEIVSVVDSPSIRWALRDFTNVKYVASPPLGQMPSIVITPQEQKAPVLAASYRGQDFAWWATPAWEGALPPEWINWLTTRDQVQSPTEQITQIILWARANLVPSEGLLPAPVLEQSPQQPLVNPQDLDPLGP